MHMADALLSPGVAGVMYAASAVAAGHSVHKLEQNRDTTDKIIPTMGVMGAFVFAAQMINFTIPGTGSSGHIGGGVLLAGLLGRKKGKRQANRRQKGERPRAAAGRKRR